MSNTKLIIFITLSLILITIGFFLYYLLIAKPQIKAACLEATTLTINLGEYTSGTESNPIVVSDGEEVDFNEDKYKDCIKAF